MDPQVVARLAAGIRDGGPVQERRRARGRAGEADARRRHGDLADRTARRRIERDGLDRGDPPGGVEHPHGLAARDDLGAGFHGARDQHLRRVVLAVVRATDLAESAADAAGPVVAEPAAGPAERLRALLEEEVVAVPSIALHLRDFEERLDLAVERVPGRGRQVLEAALGPPALEDRRRDALAEVEVVQRRSADAVALVDADAAIGGGAAAALPVEAREHLLLALHHVGGREALARLEHHDREPRLGRDHRRHRAAGARADDAEVGLEAERRGEDRGVEDHRFAPRGKVPSGATRPSYPGQLMRDAPAGS